MAVFLGNGLVAIVSGLLAHGLVVGLKMGPVAPFDAAICVLLVGGTIIISSWSENYGDANDKGSLMDTFRKAGTAIVEGVVHCLIGISQRACCFTPYLRVSMTQ